MLNFLRWVDFMTTEEKIKEEIEENTELTDYEKLHQCKCECGFSPIKHFQPCPHCKSEGYHTHIKVYIREKNKL